MGGTHTHNKLMRISPLEAEASFICLHYIKTKQNSNPQPGFGIHDTSDTGRVLYPLSYIESHPEQGR